MIYRVIIPIWIILRARGKGGLLLIIIRGKQAKIEIILGKPGHMLSWIIATQGHITQEKKGCCKTHKL